MASWLQIADWFNVRDFIDLLWYSLSAVYFLVRIILIVWLMSCEASVRWESNQDFNSMTSQRFRGEWLKASTSQLDSQLDIFKSTLLSQHVINKAEQCLVNIETSDS